MTDQEKHDLYVRYYERVVRYLTARYGLKAEEAREMAQDAFVSVFKRVKGKPIEDHWLFIRVTAHNRAANEFRSRELRRRTDGGSIDGRAGLSEVVVKDFWTNRAPDSPEEETSHREQMTLLRSAIEDLPESQRPCVLLRIDGLAYDEIATALKISLDAVKTRLRDAKKFLLKKMGAETDHGHQ